MVEDSIFLKEGHYVWIDEPYNAFYAIIRREPFDYETGEESTAVFSTVSSGNESGFKNVSDLEPDNKPLHLYQVLWGVKDTEDIKYYMKIPTGQNRFGIDTDKEIGFLNADKSPFYDPNPLYQFYLIDEWYPSINCKNNSPVTITPKVWFKGMKYDIEKVTDTATLNALKSGAPHRKIIFGGIKNTP